MNTVIIVTSSVTCTVYVPVIFAVKEKSHEQEEIINLINWQENIYTSSITVHSAE